jgi:uncharacterized membrane protein
MTAIIVIGAIVLYVGYRLARMAIEAKKAQKDANKAIKKAQDILWLNRDKENK